jgi:plastocyanin
MTWRRGRSLRLLSALLLSGGLLAGAATVVYAQALQYNVRMGNFYIEGAPAQVPAGRPLTFVVTTVAEGRPLPFPHNLAIDGNGVDLLPSNPNVEPGQTRTVTFPALQPGTYNLYCPIGTHRQAGQEVQLTVVAGAAFVPASGHATVPLGLAAAGAAAGAAGVALRLRRRASR